jgi:hypothetical protein
MKSKKRALQVKASEIQKALEKKSRFRTWSPRPE